MEVTLSEEQLDRLARLRQRRDILGPVVSLGPAAVADATEEAAAAVQESVWQDVQLQKAVEYLRQRREERTVSSQ
jgi:hypothetical protein